MTPEAVPVPANLLPFVDVLGRDAAIEFLLTFGGQTVYLAADPKGGSEIARTIGLELTRKLTAKLGARTENSYYRIPTAKPFIARCLRADGWTVGRIARRLHVTDTTVQSWTPRRSEQLQLF
jgi:hypothetical protein